MLNERAYGNIIIKYYNNITFVKNMKNIFTFVEKLYKMNKNELTKENC